MAGISIVLPAHNEASAMATLIPSLRTLYPEAELIVIDDGSDDGTGGTAQKSGARVILHPYGMGNGAAIKSGARAASRQVMVFMDADGQHAPADIERLIGKLNEGYDMVVGARGGASQASMGRWLANAFYNRFASWMVGHHVADLTSGFRAARADKFREFLHLLPNGFSYPATSTMAFFRSGYTVGYVPIVAGKRVGKSHIRPLRDGIRFLLIMFRICTLYAPLKLFLPISASVFVTGLGYYLYTYFTSGRFTNMSALLFISSLLIFLIGLVSEQITMLLYQKSNQR